MHRDVQYADFAGAKIGPLLASGKNPGAPARQNLPQVNNLDSVPKEFVARSKFR
jgi:hypothetical protein